MGVPKLLTSDQGGEFRSDLEKQIMSLLNIKRHYITPYHPQVSHTNDSSIYSLMTSIKFSGKRIRWKVESDFKAHDCEVY